MNTTGTLIVHLKYANDLKEVEWFGRQDPYVVLKCSGIVRKSSRHHNGGTCPKWDEVFLFRGVDAASTLEIEIYDKNRILRDVFVGSCSVDLSKVCAEGSATVKAPVMRGANKKRGSLVMTLKYRHEDLQDFDDAAQGIHMRNVQYLKGWITGTKSGEDVSERYVLGHKLGRGSFGTIRVATHKKTGKQYACKTICKSTLHTLDEMERVECEVQVLQHLNGHANIVGFKEVFETSQDVHIIMELCTGGDLYEDMSRRLGKESTPLKRRPYTEKVVAGYMRGIVAAVAHCHGMGVMHRDIKPENFLLSDDTPDATIKLADFGLSIFLQEGDTLSDEVGTALYMAPELLRGKYSKQADIWSCGIVLYNLLSGVSRPFKGETVGEMFEGILGQEPDLKSWPWPLVSDPAKDCVRRMLDRNPATRATAEEILHHEWMREAGVASDEEIPCEVLNRIRLFASANKVQKEALMVIAKTLPSREIAGLSKMFRDFDKDKNGVISVGEFRDGLRSLGALIPESDIQRLMANADVNKDGTIDYHEFVASTLSVVQLQREEVMVKAFQLFDNDHSGFICRGELTEVLASTELPDAVVEEVLAQIDLNGDGQIDYHEFTAMMRSANHPAEVGR